MRWMLVCIGSLATGGLAILLSLTVLFLRLLLEHQYIGIGPDGWDPFTLLGQYWKLGIFGIAMFIYGLGCGVGFWFFNRRVLSKKGNTHGRA